MKEALAIVRDTVLAIVCFPVLPLVADVIRGVEWDKESNTVYVSPKATVSIAMYALTYWSSLIVALYFLWKVLL